MGATRKSDPPEDPVRAAYEAGLEAMARRPLTRVELRARLARAGHAGAAVEAALRRLAAAGWLDDRRLAVDYILARSERLGHGRERLVRDLVRRGLEPEAAEEAWERAMRDAPVEPEELLRREAEKRVERCGGRLGPREYRRVYNALLRGGHDADAIAAVLRPFRAFPETDGD